MFKIFNENYYLDLTEVETFVNIVKPEKEEKEKDGEEVNTDDSFVHVNIVKFDLLKMLLDVIMTENETVDEKMGMSSNETTIPFKLAFNTLLNNKIIKKY